VYPPSQTAIVTTHASTENAHGVSDADILVGDRCGSALA
jgi:hypothetical protein